MANFGTPTVIGTLSSSTSQTTYTVPITATTTINDYLVVAAGSSGGGTNNIPSSITDSQNPTGYTQVPGANSTGTGQLSVWIFPASRVLTNTDTVTVTFPVANAFLKNIIVVDCPGALILDNAAIANNAGITGTQPSISAGTTATTELVLFFEQNSNSGGSPSISAPFTNLSTLHSGSAEYTSVSYQIISGAPGTFTGNATVTTGTWGTSSIGLLNTIPLYVSQQPFPIGLTPASLAFNPAIPRPTTPQKIAPTVISSAPVNITGAQSNIFTPGVNFLQGDAASFNASTGNWTNGGNTTIAQTNAVSHNALGALQCTSTGSGSLNAISSTAGKIFTNGVPCNPGDQIFAAGWVLAAATPRTAQIGVSFLDASQNVVGSTSFGPSITDSTGVWQLVTVTATVPATAFYSRISMQWSSVGAAEVHYISDATIFNITSGSGMPGQIQIFTPNQANFELQPMGVPRPLYLNGTLQFLQRQVPTGQNAIFEAGPVANVNVASSGQIQVFQTFAPQFPWQQIMPGLQFNPSLNWVKQQISTSNAPLFVDGGTAANVNVNAQFSDMAVTVSVSATQNVAVSAPTPPLLIAGVTANVNVVAQNGTVAETLSGATANVNVQARAGTANDVLIGAVANVNVQARAGVVTLGPAGPKATVNVTMAGDNVTVISTGTPANVAVASTGVATVTPQGPAAHVNVAAVNGTVTESVSATVNVPVVATPGIPAQTVAGPVANVSVTAIPGSTTIVRAIQGVTANVSVASSGVATVGFPNNTVNASVIAPAGTLDRTLAGPTANVSVVAQTPAFAGMITLQGTLYDPDIALEQFLSRQGKLLSIPVDDELESSDTD